MAGSSGGQTADGIKKARIEIIPLIDVIFFLLATFVLFTLSLNRIQSLPVDLPQAQPSANKNQDDDMIVIQLSEPGTAFWNKESIVYAEIDGRLRAALQANPNARVLITGDDKARYGAAVQAFDEVRKAGFTQVSIETTYRPAGR
jgi:biopolymer transport protein ExbD